LVQDSFRSTTGKDFPIIFYSLPESSEKAMEIVSQTKKFLSFYEKYAGPYPYRTEKLGIAETPHLGMEHSTIIAYGNKFRNGPNGFDTLMLHELGHEWWGNLVTASDWRDMWIHEGFQSYFDALYVEDTVGRDAYLKAMAGKMKATNNLQAVAPRESRFTYQIYFQAPDYLKSDGDIYGKGASNLHTLRYLIGDDAFFRSVRRMAYPKKEMESITDGKQSRLVTTDDFKQIAEDESGMDLDWFFEVYFRQPKLPELFVSKYADKIELRWETPNNLPFSMPVDVEINGVRKRIMLKNGNASFSIKPSDVVEVDKEGWVLKKITSSANKS
jgi:aminopeptidase N